MTPSLLREIGEGLHGLFWVGPLADDLGVARRTVERWRDGAYAIPEGVAAELDERIHEHQMRLVELRDRLPR